MSTKNKISLKKLPEFNTVWHEESALVFKSAKELVIVGKLVNKKIVPLQEDDIQLCDKYRFKYIVQVEEEDAEEEGEEEDAEEEEVVEGEAEGGEEEAEQSDDASVPVNDNTGYKEEVVVESAPKEEVVDVVEEVVAVVVEEKQQGGDEFANAVHSISKLWDTTNSTYRSQITRLENDLATTRKELEELHDKYNKMKVKFDGIKQLFSV
jgi:hypothetical protein